MHHLTHLRECIERQSDNELYEAFGIIVSPSRGKTCRWLPKSASAHGS